MNHEDVKVSHPLQWSVGLYIDAPEGAPDVDEKVVRYWRDPGHTMIHIDKIAMHFSGYARDVMIYRGQGAVTVTYRRRLKAGGLGVPSTNTVYPSESRKLHEGYLLPDWALEGAEAMRATAEKHVREWLA